MTKNDLIAILVPVGFIVAGLGTIAYVFTNKERAKNKKLELETKFPKEYWDARREEARASIEKKRIEEETKERLELDKRNREDECRKEQLEFEKNAPKEYWEAKKIEAQERTKQVQIKEKEITERDMTRRKFSADRYTAKANSDAIVNSARQIGYAIRGLNSLGF